MKKIIVVSILLLFAAQLASAELTEKDLEKIGNLLDKQEKRIKEYVDLKIGALEADVKSLRAEMHAEIGAVRTEIGAVRTEIGAVKWFVVTLIAIIVVLIGIPQAVQLWRERKESKEIARLNKEIERVNRICERLQQEIEDLKGQKLYGMR